jgi:hypothetical protein
MPWVGTGTCDGKSGEKSEPIIAEKDTIGAETENIKAETERFFKKRGDFKYKGEPSVLYGS